MKRVRKVSTQPGTSSEPSWTERKNPSRHDIIKALNWYNTQRDEKDAAKILGCQPSLAREHTTLAWTKRMQERGFKFSKSEQKTFIELGERFLAAKTNSTPQVKEGDSNNVVSIQERVRAKTDEIIGEMQGLVDEFGIRGNANHLNAYQWMVDNNIKPIHANKIAEFFRDCSRELLEAAKGKDKVLKEGYSTYSKTRLLNLLQVYANIVKDAERLASNANKMRKPRKKRVISADKKVSKIKYQVKDDKLKLQSVDPTRILGAQQLWIYNTKTRKLGVYNALDASGLDVKGSTIMNYSSDTSVSKTVRKPEKVLPTVTDGGKIALRRVLESINAKESKLNGRINKDTILLRVA